MGKMIFTVLGAVAELERNLIRERVNMGIARARKQGKHLCRPRVAVDPLQVDIRNDSRFHADNARQPTPEIPGLPPGS
jgi:DNA invertase Pin-like site-specific DNA recombinase